MDHTDDDRGDVLAAIARCEAALRAARGRALAGRHVDVADVRRDVAHALERRELDH